MASEFLFLGNTALYKAGKGFLYFSYEYFYGSILNT